MKELTIEEKAKAYDKAIERAKKLYGNEIAEEIFSELKESDDKNEPKFKVGDWVVNKFGDSLHIDSFDKKNYQVSDGKGNYNYFPISKQGEMHIWTIQDAKDGDVLSFYSEHKGKKMFQIGVVEKYVGKLGGCYNTFKTYVGVDWDNNLQMGKYMGCSDIHPATKEQCDTLMKTINDAGYERDIEKKELNMIKKVEIKCRRGVTYSIEAKGSKGSIFRLKNMLENCCCYVCHNHNCSNVIEGKQKCNKECELYTTVPFCKKKG